MDKNLQVLLASRPSGWVDASNFRLHEVPIAAPAEGQVLVANRWLSLDPYMRGRMNVAKSYTKYVEIGEVMVGEAVGEVIDSRHGGFSRGDIVLNRAGWQSHWLSDGADLRKVDPRLAPVQTALGVLGMPGHTAWVGVETICKPVAGETLVVDAASGAVGSVVGQLAKRRGARVVGIAGGAEKCAYVVNELGFDAAVDHRAADFYEQLKNATPQGIDACFENVGGEVFDRILQRVNPFARVALCGLVSQYNVTELYGMKNLRSVLVNRVLLQGFIVTDHEASRASAIQDLAGLIANGSLKYHETVAEGLENAPRAFIELLQGQNLGKQLVRIS
jgi:NADPH-dependent curcumin reductase CurA